MQALVEVDHEVHVLADRLSHGLDRGDVFVWALPAEAKLEPGEPALVAQLDGFVPERFRRREPEAVAVVSRDRPDGATEQHAQRHAGRLGEGIPRRHVDARHRDHRKAFVSDEMQRLSGDAEQVDWRNLAATQQLAQVPQRRNQISRGLRHVRLQVASADDAVLGLQVNEDHRPVCDRCNAGHNGPLQLEDYGPRAQSLDRQLRTP